jgi:serine/threonine protein kinase
VRFALVKELGHGGAGKVYLARNNELGRHVAVKVLYGTSLGDAKQQAQFEKELQIAAQLNHDNIVSIFHTGRFSNNHRYAVMEYIESDTLDARLKTTTFTPVECIELLLPVIQAVQYAHEKGLVAHRDLKPANILLDGNNKPHVSDFGLAVTRENDDGGELAIAGSPPYMAPEQIVGDEPSACCDIWSLGVVLYQMLTRKRPFEGGNRQRLFDKIRFNEPTFPSVACPEAQIDDELDRICLRCLKKKPEERFQRAEELGEELGEWLERRRQRYEVKVWKGIKPFRKMLDKEQNAKIKKAADEAKIDGQIRTLKRVAVRQPSLPNLELYDLGSSFRLVVLLVGGARRTRVFLYCGSDDDCQSWLADLSGLKKMAISILSRFRRPIQNRRH